MSDLDTAKMLLDELHSLGVRISIDDFGTGYSSLSYLKRLPVHEMKVDRSFVMDMATDVEDQVIVRAIVGLGQNLGLSVVAEGVEDRATWEQLRKIGCTYVQGYYLSKPMPVQEFPRWLDAYRARTLAANANRPAVGTALVRPRSGIEGAIDLRR